MGRQSTSKLGLKLWKMSILSPSLSDSFPDTPKCAAFTTQWDSRVAPTGYWDGSGLDGHIPVVGRHIWNGLELNGNCLGVFSTLLKRVMCLLNTEILIKGANCRIEG